MVVLRVVTFAVTIMTLMWQVVLVVVGKRCGATESDTPKSGRSAGEQVTQSCLCRLLMSALHLYDIVLCSGVWNCEDKINLTEGMCARTLA